MNAKRFNDYLQGKITFEDLTTPEQYQVSFRAMRTGATRWYVNNGYGRHVEYLALQSWLAVGEMDQMTFRQFIDCLEAAQCGLAYATRNHWFFVVDGQELQFTKEECARFTRYFSEGFHMNLDGYTKIVKAGGMYINPRLFEDDEVFPLRAKLYAYNRFVIGWTGCATKAGWVCNHNQAIADIEFYARLDELAQADYDTEQSDLQAEMEMQRYG